MAYHVCHFVHQCATKRPAPLTPSARTKVKSLPPWHGPPAGFIAFARAGGLTLDGYVLAVVTHVLQLRRDCPVFAAVGERALKLSTVILEVGLQFGLLVGRAPVEL